MNHLEILALEVIMLLVLASPGNKLVLNAALVQALEEVRAVVTVLQGHLRLHKKV